ncbi:Protein PEP-RELATED DEVELOPMENT ARRESTED 1, chloroplastic [Salvia divinorum]|uniref:Protein PEP-RELATED DEVELOPMENT ARRESTED 1, chloroplastic n=1 Tax=Salvia divinorum TaxID=28513 RepID=A0ABD1FY41_SALDI
MACAGVPSTAFSSVLPSLAQRRREVTSVLEEMIKLLEDMNMDEASEEVAVQLAAQGVIGKRVDQMESGFMMALDDMIQLAARNEDDMVHHNTLQNLQEIIF